MENCSKCKIEIPKTRKGLCDECYLKANNLTMGDVEDTASTLYDLGVNTKLPTGLALFGTTLKEHSEIMKKGGYCKNVRANTR